MLIKRVLQSIYLINYFEANRIGSIIPSPLPNHLSNIPLNRTASHFRQPAFVSIEMTYDNNLTLIYLSERQRELVYKPIILSLSTLLGFNYTHTRAHRFISESLRLNIEIFLFNCSLTSEQCLTRIYYTYL